jgi:hypothetical protein
MHETIEGVFHDGKIELREQPRSADPARVLVTFIRNEKREAQSEAQRQKAIEELIAQMKASKVSGGRGYGAREEIYAERFDRRQ